MDIGDKSKKYCVPVYMIATASVCAGNIYCDTEEEYKKTLEDNINDLFEEGHFNVNCHNNFDIGDSEVESLDFDADKKYYEVNR